MLEISTLNAFYGGVHALDSVNLSVAQGEVVSLLGANGAGKSTLLGAVMGIVGELDGSIRFEGAEIVNFPTEKIVAMGTALVPEGRELFDHLTVSENLWMGAYLRQDKRAVQKDLDNVYALFPRLAERRTQMAGTLSGGEQQMLAIGRGLMSKPKLLLLDEPSLGLSPMLVVEIMQLIREINRHGVTILLVEQNARQALRISNRGYLLEKGRIVKAGQANDLSSDPLVISAYIGKTSNHI